MVVKTRALDCLPLCSLSIILQTFIIKLNVCNEIWIDPWDISLKKCCNEDKLINLKIKNDIFQIPYFFSFIYMLLCIFIFNISETF